MKIRPPLLWAAAVTAALTCAASGASAQTYERVPFSGVIQLVDDETGALVNVDGTRAMRFFLYDEDGTARGFEEYSDQDSRSCAELVDCSVDIHDGRFSVALGEYTNLTDIFEDADGVSVYISMYAGGAWQSFGGQRIALAPFATRADSAADLTIDDSNLTDVDETLVGGDLQMGEAAVDGDLTVNGALDVTSVSTSEDVALTGDLDVTGDVLTPGVLALGDTLSLPLTGTDAAIAHVTSVLGLNYLYVYGDAGVRLAANRELITINADVYAGGGGTDVGLNLFTNSEVAFDDFSLDEGFDLIQTYRVDMGTSVTATLDVDPDSWRCSIGGLNFGRGDLASGSDIEGLRAYLETNADTYTIVADLPSENGDHEEHDVGIVCFSTSRTSVVSDWGWWE